MTDLFQRNRQLWSRLAEINPSTEFYDLTGFKAGKSSLTGPELDHPFLYMLDENTGDKFKYPYFHAAAPLDLESTGSYADRNFPVSLKSYEWSHSLSDVFNALLSIGMTIEFVHEFPYSVYNCFPLFEQESPGGWVVKNQATAMPLMFSIRGRL